MNPSRPRPRRRTTIYKGSIFRVERDLVRLADGRVIAMEAVRHRGSVVLVPQPAARQIIMIRQFRYVIGRWIWELPAGTLEQGESPARAARRECAEETGWRPTRVTRLGRYYPSPGFCDEQMTFYHCTGLVRPARPVVGDPDELIRVRTFALDEVWRLIDRGLIRDMKTVAGLTLLARMSSRGVPGSSRVLKNERFASM